MNLSTAPVMPLFYVRDSRIDLACNIQMPDKVFASMLLITGDVWLYCFGTFSSSITTTITYAIFNISNNYVKATKQCISCLASRGGIAPYTLKCPTEISNKCKFILRQFNYLKHQFKQI